jgi:hypothetical protein
MYSEENPVKMGGGSVDFTNRYDYLHICENKYT